MTKVRAPLSTELALTKIALQLDGWDKAAAVVDQAERTVRNWSDPDTTARIGLDDALKLDLAYRAAGGDGAPLFECYALRLEAETLAGNFTVDALLRSTAASAREHGDATASVLEAARPGAGAALFAIAERELEESISASTNTLACLRAVRKGEPCELGGAQR